MKIKLEKSQAFDSLKWGKAKWVGDESGYPDVSLVTYLKLSTVLYIISNKNAVNVFYSIFHPE